MKDPDWPRKYLVDFSQYPEFMQNTRPELVNDSAKAKWRGIIPGPYLEGYNYTIWYNKDLAKKMGIEVKQIGMTYDDFLQYVKAIDTYNKANNSKIIPILENGDWSNFNVLMVPLYMSELNDIEEAMKNNYTEKKLNAYFKTLKALEELAKYNIYQKDWKKNAFIETLKVPLNQECFFFINATWMYNYWQNINESLANKMVPNELPVFKPNSFYFGGYSIMWAVPKNAPHREEAIKFLLKLNQPDIAEKWVRYTKCPSGIKGNVTSVSFGKDHFEDFTVNINKKYGSNKFPFSFFDHAANLILGEKHRDINNHTVDVVTGLISADEAIADIKRQLRL
jgi:ABC-type glycerol-3-phosphate transport system substrate-binding protein